ncbi:DUF3108 domain-containing protein [Natronospira bacteriovora]|uniref:DUF3108 domain-containing protein n=1 Tax=Natronospira bacteriovora TaxID=3069753 RepID=A0ABU0W618_9GAMM|nr:DUF3108 domain-containing protein [Natronospira sp. AB-CW4]MDQ2069451.1 DUF3108 domain-containing protein [Natronospira sp. AB-CW4]
MISRRLAVFLLPLLLSTALWPMAGSASERAFEAEYRAFYGSMRGATTRFWLESAGDDEWLWQSRSEPAGMVSMFRDDIVTERSRFRVSNEGLQPLSYRYHHQYRGDTRRERTLNFNWNRQEVRFDDDGDTGTLPLKNGSLDRFLAQYALMRDLARGERPERYLIVYRDEAFEQDLRYQGEERVRTRAGRFSTVKVAMEDEDSDRKLVVWMAPELGYLPVRLEQREPGETTVRMELESTNRQMR